MANSQEISLQTANSVEAERVPGSDPGINLPPHATRIWPIFVEGQDLARIAVRPGDVVQLTFGPQSELSARLGENGNLAIKVGDITVILEGYTPAAAEQAVTLEYANGQPIDVPAILAETDPTLDIQTAAGDGTGAGPIDNNGAIFEVFTPSDGAGGFSAVGGLRPTDLPSATLPQPALINREFPTNEPQLNDGVPTIGAQTVIRVDEDSWVPVRSMFGQGDDDANLGESPAVDPRETVWHGRLIYDYGSDGKGDVVLATSVGGVGGTGLTDLNGNVIVTTYDIITHTLTGFADTGPKGVDAGDATVFALKINDIDTGDFTFTLFQPIKHPGHGLGGNFEDNLTLPIDITVTDKDGDVAQGSVILDIDDDVPAMETYSITNGGYLDEDFSTFGNKDKWESPDDGTGTYFANGAFGIKFGADGAATLPFAFETVTDADFASYKTSNGHDLKVTVSTANEIVVVDAETNSVVFDLGWPDLGASNWYFHLHGGLQHQSGAEGTEDDLTLSFFARAFDGDGDYTLLPIQLTIDDDMPDLIGRTGFGEGSGVFSDTIDGQVLNGISGRVDEDWIAGGNRDFPDSSGDTSGKDSASGEFTISFGADGRGSTSFALDVVTDADFADYKTSAGHDLKVQVSEANQVIVVDATDGTAVFTLSSFGIGDSLLWSFTLHSALQHELETESTEDDLILNFTGKAFDGDGDFLLLPIRIFVNDDMPRAGGGFETVHDSAIQSSLLSEGDSFGADGGFVNSIDLDGMRYIYNPDDGGSVFALGFGIDRGSFDTSTNVLTIGTKAGATFAIDMDDGDYDYLPASGKIYEEKIFYALSDNDGDLATNSLTLQVNAQAFAAATVDDADVIDGFRDTAGRGRPGQQDLDTLFDGIGAPLLTLPSDNDVTAAFKATNVPMNVILNDIHAETLSAIID